MIFLLLAFDVGNTNIVFGVYKEKELIRYWRMSTDKSKTSDELAMFVNQRYNFIGCAYNYVLSSAYGI